MKNRLKIIYLSLVVLLGSSIQTFAQANLKPITALALSDSLKKASQLLVDVRTPQETEKGYIEGATFINFYDSDFVEQLNNLDKNRTVYVYCQASGRSKKAAEILIGAGYSRVYYLSGGIMDWQKSELPLKTNNLK